MSPRRPLPQASRSRCWRSNSDARRLQQIAAELADILEQRAVEARDVLPEIRGREFFGERDGCAGKQHAAGRDHAADGMIDRQAIIKAIVRRRAGEACEPAAPVEDAAMADAGGLRQARGARGIDQQRAIVDGDVAPFGRRQRTAVELRERGIDILIAPDLRRAARAAAARSRRHRQARSRG